MNYTTNYHLPQWVESDRIMMEDFNDAMSGIDQGLAGVQSAAAAAQSAAGTAQAAADAAYSPDNMPYAVGSYTGTGSPLTITLGFQPRFVIVTGQVAAGAGAYGVTSYAGFSGGAQISSLLVFEENGFTLTGHDEYPAINLSGVNYSYLAFR